MTKRGNIITEKKMLLWKAEIEKTLDDFARNWPSKILMEDLQRNLASVAAHLEAYKQGLRELEEKVKKMESGVAIIAMPEDKLDWIKEEEEDE